MWPALSKVRFAWHTCGLQREHLWALCVVVQGDGMRLFPRLGVRKCGLVDGGAKSCAARIQRGARGLLAVNGASSASSAVGACVREACGNLQLGSARELAGRMRSSSSSPSLSPPKKFVKRSSPGGPYGDACVQQASRALDVIGGNDWQP